MKAQALFLNAFFPVFSPCYFPDDSLLRFQWASHLNSVSEKDFHVISPLSSIQARIDNLGITFLLQPLPYAALDPKHSRPYLNKF